MIPFDKKILHDLFVIVIPFTAYSQVQGMLFVLMVIGLPRSPIRVIPFLAGDPFPCALRLFVCSTQPILKKICRECFDDPIAFLFCGTKRIEGFQTQIQQNGSMLWVKINAELFWEHGYIEGSMCDISVSKLLTPMEKEVLKILLQGSCNSEIAYILNWSIRTIEEHRARIMKKLGVHNIIELTKKSLMAAWQE